MPRDAKASTDPARSSTQRARKSAAPKGPSAGASSSQPPRNVRLPRPKTPKGDKERGPGLGERLRSASQRAGALRQRFSRPAAIAFKILLMCAALAGAVALGKVLQRHLTTSPAFAIDKIDVKGLVRMERAELLAAAGIAEGRNVFEHSPGAVQARLLKHPWIAEASVSRRLPGSFAITLREREPVALLVVEPCGELKGARGDEASACDDGSALYLLSDDGKLFKRFDAKDPVDLPVVTGIDRERFGQDPEFHQTILLEVAQLVHDYKSQGLWAKLPISEIHVEPSDGFSLYVGSDLTLVRLGVAPFAQKLPKMKKVFARLEQEHASAEYVYLDNEERPDRVTVRLR